MDRFRRLAPLTLVVALPATTAGPQARDADISTAAPPQFTIQAPRPYTTQVISGIGLPGGAVFVLWIGGRSTVTSQTDPTGRFAGSIDVTSIPPALPRTLALRFGMQTFAGTEFEGAYPKTIPLSPRGALLLEPPQNRATAEIWAAGFPPNCPTSVLSAIRGVVTNRTFLGAPATSTDGSWASGFHFPAVADDASHYLWEGGASCTGLALRGVNPAGPFPRTVRLAPFDVSDVPPVMTVQPPRASVNQTVRGAGLTSAAGFLLILGGVHINAGNTDVEGDFGYNFEVTRAPGVFPRAVVVDFDTETFEGTEFDGPYPKTILLDPHGTVVLEQPEKQHSAVIEGAGFPPNCEARLWAVPYGVRFPIGGFSSGVNGYWSANFDFPTQAEAATRYVWEGEDSCARKAFEGANPYGTYPRDVAFSRVIRRLRRQNRQPTTGP
jgi:hypothetical protein